MTSHRHLIFKRLSHFTTFPRLICFTFCWSCQGTTKQQSSIKKHSSDWISLEWWAVRSDCDCLAILTCTVLCFSGQLTPSKVRAHLNRRHREWVWFGVLFWQIPTDRYPVIENDPVTQDRLKLCSLIGGITIIWFISYNIILPSKRKEAKSTSRTFESFRGVVVASFGCFIQGVYCSFCSELSQRWGQRLCRYRTCSCSSWTGRSAQNCSALYNTDN